MFSLDEIRIMTNNFDQDLVVGKGGCAKVYKGSYKGGNVAVKQLFESSNQVEEFAKEMLVGVTAVSYCKIKLIGLCLEGGEKVLIYEFMPLGSLYDLLYKDGATPLSWDQRYKILNRVGNGLYYLQAVCGPDIKILHGDVKSSNILLDEDFEAKLSDFGTSEPTLPGRDNVRPEAMKYTPAYVDPVYKRTGILTMESDIYSFGMLMLELLCGKDAFHKMHRDAIRDGRLDGLVDPNIQAQISKEGLDAYINLCFRCLNNEPKERPPIFEVLNELSKIETGKEPDNPAGRIVYTSSAEAYEFDQLGIDIEKMYFHSRTEGLIPVSEIRKSRAASREEAARGRE